MKRRTLLVAILTLLTVTPAFAQSRGATADPVSGTWTEGPDDGASLMLKFDGKRNVSGSVGTPHGSYPIKIGTFDRKTGALKLEGEAKKQDGTMVNYVIEGKIEKDTATGKYTFGTDKGDFRMTRAPAQKPGKKTPQQIQASYDAHKGDFDYLLGDWEFTSVNKEFGKGRGYWSAVRLDEGQILDEYRVVGDAGETYYVTTTLRNYNSVLDRWELVGADAGTGLQDVGTGRRVGAEMHIEQKFGVMSATPSVWKIRYYDIGKDRFSWSADRSTDGGKTWTKDHQQIEARRIGPPRSLGPLAPARKTAGEGL